MQKGADLKKFADIMNPRNWLTLHLVMTPLAFLLFRPDFIEIVCLLLADFPMVPIIALIDRKVLYRLIPSSRLWFQDINWNAFGVMNDREQVAMLQQLLEYPRRRANLFALMSLIKVIPAFCVVVFYFKHQGPFSLHVAKFVVSALLSLFYGYASVFLDNHKAVSQLIADIHQRFDWSRALSSVEISKSSVSLAKNDNMVLVAVSILTLLVEFTVILDVDSYSKTSFTLCLAWIAGGSLFLIMNYLASSRHYIYSALDKVFSAFESYDPRSPTYAVIPIHSLDVLARFEKTYNQLSLKLRENELELSRWVYNQSEKQRFRALGEVAALVVHDIANPVHTIGYCAEALQTGTNVSANGRYVEIISQNVDKVKGLIKSLRAFLKREGTDSVCNIVEAHTNVLNLLATQYHSSNFQRIQFVVDKRLEEFNIRFNMNEMIHVLLNLYSNAIKNFISHEIGDGKIELTLRHSDPSFLIVCVRDNGTGLSPDDFAQLTGYGFYAPKEKSTTKHGLGLRLTCRLVEQLGGEILLDENHFMAAGRGTSFVLKIPLRQSAIENELLRMEIQS